MNIKIFDNAQFGQVRTAVGQNGEPMFCLTDVARVLGIKNPWDTKTRLDAKGIGTTEVSTPIISQGRDTGQMKEVQMTFINEPNLYRCIFQSRKKEAEAFQNWIFEEVIPEIRKSGGYMVAREEETEEELMARALSVANRTLERVREENRELKKRNETLEENYDIARGYASYAAGVLLSDNTYTMTEVAKEFGFSAREFAKRLHALGIIYRHGNGMWVLYAKYQNKDYTRVRTYLQETPNGDRVHSSLVWTETGRMFLRALRIGRLDSNGNIIMSHKKYKALNVQEPLGLLVAK